MLKEIKAPIILTLVILILSSAIIYLHMSVKNTKLQLEIVNNQLTIQKTVTDTLRGKIEMDETHYKEFRLGSNMIVQNHAAIEEDRNKQIRDIERDKDLDERAKNAKRDKVEIYSIWKAYCVSNPHSNCPVP